MYTPTAVVLRDIATGDILLWNMGPDRSRPYVSIMIEEVALSSGEFRARAWKLVARSLDTFASRAIDRPEQKSQEAVRQAFQRARRLQKRCLYLEVHREVADSLLLVLCRGKGGYWDEQGRATIATPSADEEFVVALENIGFLPNL